MKFAARLLAPVATVLLTFLPSVRGQIILNDISLWNYIDNTAAGNSCYDTPVPGLFEATDDGIRIATDGFRGAGEMMTKSPYSLAGKTIKYTWSGNGGSNYMQLVLGQLTTQYLTDPGAQVNNCVNGSFGNSFENSFIPKPMAPLSPG